MVLLDFSGVHASDASFFVKYVCSSYLTYFQLLLFYIFPFSYICLLGPFANVNDYSYLSQNETYMPSAFQREFGGKGAYHHSMVAVLPQYKYSVSVRSLPQYATVPFGWALWRFNHHSWKLCHESISYYCWVCHRI